MSTDSCERQTRGGDPAQAGAGGTQAQPLRAAEANENRPASVSSPMAGLRVSAAACDAPNRVALVAGGHTWTFAQLAARVGPIAAGLPDAPIAVRAEASVEAVVVMLAAFERGCPVVPLHPRWTASEVAARLGDACPIDPACPPVGTRRARWPEPLPAAPLLRLYTSGSTGQPKPVVLTRAMVAASAAASAERLRWRPDDRWLLATPLAHVSGLGVLTRCLIARRCAVLQSRFDPAEVLAAIDAGATMASVVPTMLARLLEADADNRLARLRVLLVGGAAAPQPLLAECARRRVRLAVTYGLTEASSQVATQAPRRHLQRGVGRPLAGVQVRTSADGEILVRGPTVATDGWLATGDLGRIDRRGCLHVLGRSSELIVTGGENVHPTEVEAALLACPGVAAAVVFGVPDAVWGEQVAAAVVVAPGAPLPRPEVAGFRRPRLGCTVAELPLTAGGKVDRAAAARQFIPLLTEWPR